jgi:localization factor PodJL
VRYRRRSYRDFEDDDLDLIGENLEAVTDRLDDLARQVARLSRRRDERDALADSHEPRERQDRRRYEVASEERPAARESGSHSRDDAMHPVPNWLPESEAAAGENSISPQAPHVHGTAPPEPAPTLVPAIDLSGLESQLRQITEQLADFRQPCRIDDAVAALRNDLAEVSRAFNEAMPRQAIEVLEQEIRGLAASVDRSMESGAEVAKFAQLEHGLAEVRDNVRNLKPAEYLVEITQAVKHLTHRIEQVAAATQNPVALQKLDQAIAGLRVIVSHVASNDTVGKLAEEIRGLSTRFEHAIAENSARTISNIDRQITTLMAGSNTVSPELKSLIERSHGVSPELRSLIASIGEQVQQTQAYQAPPSAAAPAQLSQSDKLALSSIEDRITKLAGKLDDSDAWLTRLGTIEHGIGDLLLYLEEQRSSSPPAAPQHHGQAHAHDHVREHVNNRANENVNGESAALAMETEAPAPSEQAAEESFTPPPAAFAHSAPKPFTPPTTTSFIPPIPTHATPMEAIVATSSSPNLAPNGASHSSEHVSSEHVSAEHASTSSPADEANGEAVETANEPLISQLRRAINPDLPPDTPIEPNPEPVSPRASAAERITASEAALGNAKPAAREVATQFETLIAARRAAFAAGSEASGASVAPFKPVLVEGAEQQPVKRPIGLYVRQGLVAVSVLLIVLFAAKTVWDMWSTPDTVTPAPAQTKMPLPALPPVAPEQPNPPTAAPDGIKNLPSMPMPAPETVPQTPPQEFPTNPIPISPPNGSSPDPLGDSGIIKTMPEVTGALTQPNFNPNAATVELPATIGGPMLRAAATGGNPAAEYEVAVRYLDGRGVTANAEEAARWLERSAKTGFAPALFRLGGLYDKGGALKKDRAVARALYTAAAEKGHAKAMHNLAVLYAEGFDGKPNYRLAAFWFRKAADCGIADSQYNLAILYIRGIGIEQNLTESYKWFALAAEQGDQEAAKKRDEVSERLDEPALNAAQVAVQTFNVAPQPEQAVGLRVPAGGWDRGTANNAQPQPPAKPRVKPQGTDGSIPNILLSPAPL